jgi:hypothetical protein
MFITVSLRSGSIVNRGSVQFDVPTDVQPGDFTLRPTGVPVTVTQASGITGTPKQPARNFAAIPVDTVKEDGAGVRYLLSFSLPFDTVFDLCHLGQKISTGHQLYGDLDRDGSVGTDDVTKMNASLDKSDGDPDYQAGADIDDDGFVDTLDRYQPRTFRPGTTWAY